MRKPSSLLLNDSLALLIASVASVLAGALRLKLSAVWFSPQGTATIAQLTQLYVVIFTVATLGLSTGIRVTLAKVPDSERRADLAWRVVAISVAAACVLVACAQPFASFLAERFLDDAGGAGSIRIALLAAVPAVAAQTISAVIQSEGQFARLATATVLGSVVSSVCIVVIASSGQFLWLVWTIPLLPLVQLACLLAVSPVARRLAAGRKRLTFEGLSGVFQIGAFSFVLAGADTLGDTLVKGTLAAHGGLALVAKLQPTYLLTGQAFTLLLGSVASALMVHVARGLAQGHRAMAGQLHATALQFVIVIAVFAFVAQAALVLIVEVMFSRAFLPGVETARLAISAEPINALAWAYGASLLPLGRRRAWLGIGLSTVATLSGSALLLLPTLAESAVAVAYFAGWGVSAFGTTLALRASGMQPSRETLLVSVGGSGLLVVSAWLAGDASIAWQPLVVGLAFCALVARSIQRSSRVEEVTV